MTLTAVIRNSYSCMMTSADTPTRCAALHLPITFRVLLHSRLSLVGLYKLPKQAFLNFFIVNYLVIYPSLSMFLARSAQCIETLVTECAATIADIEA